MTKTILIVDDHEALRRELRSWVAASFPECRCAEAASGEEALALARAAPPDLVLMDFKLPGMDGVDAVRQLKILCPGARFIVMSQHDMTQMAGSAEKTGVHALLAKQDINTRLLPLLREQLGEAP